MAWIQLACVAVLMIQVSGLSCYSCSDGDFDGETSFSGSCYTIDNLTSNTTCSSNNYCQTRFIFNDGIATSIRRGCASGSTDHDSSTDWMPVANKCHMNLDTAASYQSVDTATCYSHCNSADDCNTVSLSTLKICGSDCGRLRIVGRYRPSRGYCDYISGKCACQSGWTGSDCNSTVTPTPPANRRKCVQCDSETDKGCTTKKDGASCPGSESYCSSTQTSIYTESGVVRRIMIRGCTGTHIAVDECRFTNIYSDNGINDRGYNEFTCYSTCDTDNCNINTPNGIMDIDEKPLLKCHQCHVTGSSCTSPSPMICPSGSTHCKSTVTYVISDKVDEKYIVSSPSSYKILSNVRECATQAVTPGCTESMIDDLSFKKVTCQETCQDDGCNIGWPARPKCIQCSTSYSDLRYGNDVCLKSPLSASDCPHPYHKYCIIKDQGLEEGTRASLSGYPRSIERGCSYIDIGTNCTKTTVRDKAIQNCNYTCSSDGCNVGSGSPAIQNTDYFVLALLLFGATRQIV